MQWIKSHVMIVVCGSLGLAGVVLVVLGILMSDVAETMARDTGLVSSMQNIRPINEETIKIIKDYQDANARRLEDAKKALAARVGGYQPLTENVFPEIPPDRQDAPYGFQAAFAARQKQLIDVVLQAGEAPTDDEVAREKDRMEAARQLQEQQKKLGVSTAAEKERAIAIPAGPIQTPGLSRVEGPARDAQRDDKALLQLPVEELVRQDPWASISVRRAWGIRCYANVGVLKVQPDVTAPDLRPTAYEMWLAQAALWVQEDIIKALADLNDRVAKDLEAQGQKVWVGVLPVKHLNLFAVDGYVTSATAGAAPGGGSGSGAVVGSFTGNACNATQDVIRLRLGLIVSARMLPSVLDAISAVGFYTPLSVTYKSVAPNPLLRGYVYGPESVIDVTLDIEGCFLRAKYEQWMPKQIKDDITSGAIAGRTGSSGGGGDPRGMPSPSGRGPRGMDRSPFGRGPRDLGGS